MTQFVFSDLGTYQPRQWNVYSTTKRKLTEDYGIPVLKSVSYGSVRRKWIASELATIEIRFVIEEYYKYTFNNGHLAIPDSKAAVINYLNALENIPGIIVQRKEKNEALEKNILQLQELAGKVWMKEDELKLLKTELSVLDCNIQLELAENNFFPENVKEEHIIMEYPIREI